MSERDWREMFRVEPAETKAHFETEAGDCNANCLQAKELVCVCKCGGKNHGAALKKHVQPLDQFNEPEPQELGVAAIAA